VLSCLSIELSALLILWRVVAEARSWQAMVSVRTSIVPARPCAATRTHAEHISRCHDIPGHSLNSRLAVQGRLAR
jgi:hypothetical protein